MNLPNVLTLARIATIPILMLLLLSRFQYHDQVAAGLFVLASLTDTMDGQLARRRGQVTELGKFLDPLADKLFILAVLIVLVQLSRIPAWVVVLIFGRELLITILRTVSASQGRVVGATPFGKTKTLTQVGAVLILILEGPYPALTGVATVAIAIAVAFTLVSGLDYVWRFRYLLLGDAGAAPARFRSLSGGAPGAESAVDPLAERLGAELAGGRFSVVTAESCTGGLVATLITDQPGSSAYFKGGVVAYSNQVKEDVLGVPGALLISPGAVSAEVAQAMAEGARKRLGADFAVAVTGISGPGAESTEKPVGLTHIWVVGPLGGAGRRFVFEGDRWANRREAARAALELLLEEVGRVAIQTSVR